LRQALDKVQNVLSSDAVCFYAMEYDFLQLKVQRGLSSPQQAALQNLPPDWLFFGFEVRVDLNPAHTRDLPPAIGRAGFNASMFKWVPLPDKIPGVVGCFWQGPREFTVEDIALFSAFTDGLGIILENSRLRQSVTQNAMAAERQRLARDLHDSVTQSLHSLVLTAELSNRQSRPETAQKLRQHLVDSARQALKEMRLLLYELQLASPQEIGLVTALQTRLESVERRAGVEVQLAVDKNATWPKNWDDQLYPIAIEALNNALKHAHATHITITLRGDAHQFKMCIADNGCGFAVPGQTNRGGMGLRNLTERAELLGGQLNIKSVAGQGTAVTVAIDRRRSMPVSPEV
jgi:signal transduction histidine kinase